jgi:hypothetical protein
MVILLLAIVVLLGVVFANVIHLEESPQWPFFITEPLNFYTTFWDSNTTD